MSERTPVTPRPAAVVVLMREAAGGILVFMVRRHARIEFMPDVYVFPGGSVSTDDAQAERAPALCAPVPEGPTALGQGLRAAALRECFEEAGVLLVRRGRALLSIEPAEVARFAAYRDALNARTMTLGEVATREGLTLATDELVYWAHWITPEISPKRFDTHFFLAAMPPGQEAVHDQLETTASLWITPEAALAGAASGELPIVDPTTHQLRALASLATVAAARRRFAGVKPRTILPRIIYRDGEEISLLPDDCEDDLARGASPAP